MRKEDGARLELALFVFLRFQIYGVTPSLFSSAALEVSNLISISLIPSWSQSCQQTIGTSWFQVALIEKGLPQSLLWKQLKRVLLY